MTRKGYCDGLNKGTMKHLMGAISMSEKHFEGCAQVLGVNRSSSGVARTYISRPDATKTIGDGAGASCSCVPSHDVWRFRGHLMFLFSPIAWSIYNARPAHLKRSRWWQIVFPFLRKRARALSSSFFFNVMSLYRRRRSADGHHLFRKKKP